MKLQHSQPNFLLVIAGGIIFLLITGFNFVPEPEMKVNHLAALQVTVHEPDKPQPELSQTETTLKLAQVAVENSEPTQQVPENPESTQQAPEKQPESAETSPENLANKPSSSQPTNIPQVKPATDQQGEIIFFPENYVPSATTPEHLLKLEKLLRERGWQVKNYGDAGLILIPSVQP